MSTRLRAFNAFVGYFVRYALRVREVLAGLLVLIVAGGFLISKLEGIELGEAIYFAFITGFTIGYGDIAPDSALGRVISVAIGLIGMIFTGVTVAIAVRALTDFLGDHEGHVK